MTRSSVIHVLYSCMYYSYVRIIQSHCLFWRKSQPTPFLRLGEFPFGPAPHGFAHLKLDRNSFPRLFSVPEGRASYHFMSLCHCRVLCTGCTLVP